MLGRKLMLVQKKPRTNLSVDDLHFEIPHLDEIKETTGKNIKKYGYTALVVSLRLYIRSMNALKQQYKELSKKLAAMRKKNMSGLNIDKQEQRVSSFLEMMSQYKHKIRRIKHQIAKEEESQ